ncbi:MAG: ABC transporter permease [Candidatus Dormibacteria bacterium]
MWRYIVKRLLLGVVTVFIISAVIYLLIEQLPGSYIDSLLHQPRQSEAQRAALAHYYGRDRPVIVRYFNWLVDAVHGDLGFSFSRNQTVLEAISQRILPTAILMGVSYIITLLIAVPIGIISAVKQYSKLDTGVTAFSFFGYALPNYWFGAILIFVFAIPHGGHAGVLPVGGILSNSSTDYVGNLGDLAVHLIMPTIVLTVQSVAVYSRYVRSTMMETLRQDYIRTARAKGLTPRTIILRHGFRNSLLPLITLVALDLPQLFVGAVITEFVFNWPGMGQLFVRAAGDKDTALLVGVLLILATFVVVFNLLADLLYSVADPRISYEGAH